MDSKGGLPSRLTPYIFPAAIVVLVCLILSLLVFYPIIGIKGLSALIGLVAASYIWYSKPPLEFKSLTSIPVNNTNALKLILSVTLLAITFELLGVPRFYILVIAYTIALLVFCVSFRTEIKTKIAIACICCIFIINPVTKYLNTGFYFGGGDLFDHVRFIGELQGGHISAMSNYAYSRLPVLHISTSIISKISGISGYDSLIAFGIISYLGGVILITLIGRKVYNDKIAILVSFSLIFIPFIQYYSTYFFPQSLAVIYVVLLLSISVYTHSFPKLKWTIPVVGAAAVLTHHLTLIFTGFIFSGFWIYNKITFTKSRNYQLGLLLAISLASIAYNAFTYSFFNTLVLFALKLIGGISPASGPQSGLIRFGTTQDIATIQTAIQSLVTVDGFQQFALIALISLSLVALLNSWERFNKSAPLLLSGGVGSLFIVQLPFQIPFHQRLGHLLSPFTAVFLSLGVWRALTSVSRPQLILALLIVVSAGTTSALVTADDIEYRGDNNLMQNSYDEQEWSQLQSAAKFGKSSTPTVFWISREAFLYHGTQTAAPVEASSAGIKINRGLLLVRQNWVHHQVGIKPTNSSLRKMTIDADVLAHEEFRRSKVFDSGSTSYLYINGNRTIFR